MNWKPVIMSVGAGAAVGTAVYFLYDPVKNAVGKLKEKKHKPKYATAGRDGYIEPNGWDFSVRDEYEILAKSYSAADHPTESVQVETIDLDAFLDLDEEKRHVCTYFRKDKVLAGTDDELEMMDIDETFGDHGAEILQDCELDSVYILRLDDGEAYEIVMSDEDYDSSYMEYQSIRSSMENHIWQEE